MLVLRRRNQALSRLQRGRTRIPRTAATNRAQTLRITRMARIGQGSGSFVSPIGCMVSSGSPTGDQSLAGHRAEIAQLVEHATENRGVASSILALGTIRRKRVVEAITSGSGSVGRASPCQGEGRGFESRLPLHFPARGLPRGCARTSPLPLRPVVGQRTLNPRTEVRILEGQPDRIDAGRRPDRPPARCRRRHGRRGEVA